MSFWTLSCPTPRLAIEKSKLQRSARGWRPASALRMRNARRSPRLERTAGNERVTSGRRFGRRRRLSTRRSSVDDRPGKRAMSRRLLLLASAPAAGEALVIAEWLRDRWLGKVVVSGWPAV